MKTKRAKRLVKIGLPSLLLLLAALLAAGSLIALIVRARRKNA